MFPDTWLIMAPGKKRPYKEAFLRCGFTCIVDKSIEKPQCVLCSKIRSAESMQPSKLKDHFERSHVEFAEKDIELLKKERILKSTGVDSTGHFALISSLSVLLNLRKHSGRISSSPA